MPKRPSINAALNAVSNNPPSIQPKPGAEEERIEEQAPVSKPYTAPSRKNLKALTGYFDPAVIKQLKQIALDKDRTVQSMHNEALNDLFIKYGKGPIA